MENNTEEEPHIIIIEQPQPRALRFRYPCENRGSNSGSILGMNSTDTLRSYPTVKIVGFQGRAKVVVSCVTIDTPPKCHPHKLIGHHCNAGVCKGDIGPETSMQFSLSNVGIQCVRKRDVDAALTKRYKEIIVSGSLSNNLIPPLTAPDDNSTSVDLNALRLCFQVFLETEPNQFTYALPPAVSSEIYDKKSNPDLKIHELSDSTASVKGGKKIILLCEKVNRNNIAVLFIKERPHDKTWSAFATFNPHDVHKQVAIVFNTPAYDDLDITEPVMVNIQLLRPKDMSVSEPIEFKLVPCAKELLFKQHPDPFCSSMLSLPSFEAIRNPQPGTSQQN